MKNTILLSLLPLALLPNVAHSQNEKSTYHLREHLPNDLILDKSIVRSYQLTTDYYDYDLKSNFLVKRRICGTITYENDFAEWKDVYYAESKVVDEVFPQGDKLNSLQNFRYQPKEDILAADFFQKRLPQANPYVMNLIWDALCFESLAYWAWDSLKLNKEYQLRDDNSKLDLAIGSFENKGIKITWIGVTKVNDEICAILKYSVMNNPLKVEFENISMSGRSHYWGEIYVSLSDKQIEYASLTEDVLTDMNIKGQGNNVIGYTTRSISLLKVK